VGSRFAKLRCAATETGRVQVGAKASATTRTTKLKESCKDFPEYASWAFRFPHAGSMRPGTTWAFRIRRRRGTSPIAPRKQKERRITSVLLPELKHPMSVIGRQISVPGSAWSGHLTAAESATLYKCTVLNRMIAHRFTPTGSPQEAWKVQEMGESGDGSLKKKPF